MSQKNDSTAASKADVNPPVIKWSKAESWQILLQAPFLFWIFVPISEYVARLRLATQLLHLVSRPMLWTLSGFSSSMWIESSDVLNNRGIIVSSLFYAAVVFIWTATLSIYGQCVGADAGYLNREPRIAKAGLTGFSHRLTATHQALLEIFPIFVITAVFAQIIAPTDSHIVELINIHVVSKSFIYITVYAADLDLFRSLSHFLSVGACLKALYLLAVMKA